MTHFLDVHLGPNGMLSGQHAKLIFQLHGYRRSSPSSVLALDFPKWEEATDTLAPSPGNVLRLHGTEKVIRDVRRQGWLIKQVEQLGGRLGDEGDSPRSPGSWVSFTRSHKVDRLLNLLNNPQKIVVTGQEGETPEHFQVLSRQLGIPAAKLHTMDTLSNKLIAERRQCARFVIQSGSTNREFDLFVRRERLDEKPTGPFEFSNYGLSSNGSAVPSL
ncbi:type I-F CRISPR-associated endoribonuclease Cas6/Csy4 [Pseudomonas aeruginosa]